MAIVWCNTSMMSFYQILHFLNLTGGQIIVLGLTCAKCFLMVVHDWRLESKAPMKMLLETQIEDTLLLL